MPALDDTRTNVRSPVRLTMPPPRSRLSEPPPRGVHSVISGKISGTPQMKNGADNATTHFVRELTAVFLGEKVVTSAGGRTSKNASLRLSRKSSNSKGSATQTHAEGTTGSSMKEPLLAPTMSERIICIALPHEDGFKSSSSLPTQRVITADRVAGIYSRIFVKPDLYNCTRQEAAHASMERGVFCYSWGKMRQWFLAQERIGGEEAEEGAEDGTPDHESSTTSSRGARVCDFKALVCVLRKALVWNLQRIGFLVETVRVETDRVYLLLSYDSGWKFFDDDETTRTTKKNGQNYTYVLGLGRSIPDTGEPLLFREARRQGQIAALNPLIVDIEAFEPCHPRTFYSLAYVLSRPWQRGHVEVVERLRELVEWWEQVLKDRWGYKARRRQGAGSNLAIVDPEEQDSTRSSVSTASTGRRSSDDEQTENEAASSNHAADDSSSMNESEVAAEQKVGDGEEKHRLSASPRKRLRVKPSKKDKMVAAASSSSLNFSTLTAASALTTRTDTLPRKSSSVPLSRHEAGLALVQDLHGSLRNFDFERAKASLHYYRAELEKCATVDSLDTVISAMYDDELSMSLRHMTQRYANDVLRGAVAKVGGTTTKGRSVQPHAAGRKARSPLKNCAAAPGESTSLGAGSCLAGSKNGRPSATSISAQRSAGTAATCPRDVNLTFDNDFVPEEFGLESDYDPMEADMVEQAGDVAESDNAAEEKNKNRKNLGQRLASSPIEVAKKLLSSCEGAIVKGGHLMEEFGNDMFVCGLEDVIENHKHVVGEGSGNKDSAAGSGVGSTDKIKSKRTKDGAARKKESASKLEAIWLPIRWMRRMAWKWVALPAGNAVKKSTGRAGKGAKRLLIEAGMVEQKVKQASRDRAGRSIYDRAYEYYLKLRKADVAADPSELLEKVNERYKKSGTIVVGSSKDAPNAPRATLSGVTMSKSDASSAGANKGEGDEDVLHNLWSSLNLPKGGLPLFAHVGAFDVPRSYWLHHHVRSAQNLHLDYFRLFPDAFEEQGPVAGGQEPRPDDEKQLPPIYGKNNGTCTATSGVGERQKTFQSMFSSCQRVRLAYDVLLRSINLSYLEDEHLLEAHFALDNPERNSMREFSTGTWGQHCEEINKRQAKKKWKVGDVCECVKLFFKDLSFKVPLEDIHDYYGPSLAFYFAFVAFFARGLIPLAVLGLLLVALSFARSWTISQEKDDESLWEIPSTAFGIYSCCTSLWCSVFLANWRRNESHLRVKWYGLPHGNEKQLGYVEPLRPRYKGTPIRSPITGEPGALFFPSSVRVFRQGVSWVLLSALLGVSIWLVLLIAKLRTYLVDQTTPDQVVLVKLIQVATGWLNTIQINVFNTIGDSLARHCNEWENYPSRRRFCNALIVKLFVFRFINNFNVFFYIGFAKTYIEGCVEGGRVVRDGGACVEELQFNYALIFLIQALSNVWELYGAVVSAKLSKKFSRAKDDSADNPTPALRTSARAAPWNAANFDATYVGACAHVFSRTGGDSMSHRTARVGADINAEAPDRKISKTSSAGHSSSTTAVSSVETQNLDARLAALDRREEVREESGRGGLQSFVGGASATESKQHCTSEQKSYWRSMKDALSDMMDKPSYGDHELDGTFEDWVEIVVLFGDVTLFSVVFPLAPLFAMILSLIEIRIDSYKIFKFHRRPTPRRCVGIGSWLYLLELVSWFSLVTNAALLVWTFGVIPTDDHWVTFTMLLCTLGLLKYSLEFFIPTVPTNMKTIVARHRLLLDRVASSSGALSRGRAGGLEESGGRYGGAKTSGTGGVQLQVEKCGRTSENNAGGDEYNQQEISRALDAALTVHQPLEIGHEEPISEHCPEYFVHVAHFGYEPTDFLDA